MHRRPQQKSGEACELRWNVRLSHVETPQVLRQFQAAFEQYWEEGEFEPYDPTADADRVDQALSSEQRTGAETLALHIDVRPYLFQQEILDQSLATFRVVLKDGAFGDHSSRSLSVV